LWFFARRVPEVEDLHEVFVLADLVVHHNGAVREFAHLRPLADGAAHARKATKQFFVIEQRIPEARGSITVVFCNVADDLSEIV